jgi:hypothetical protein
MALITQAVLGKAAVAVNSMSTPERVRLADEVFVHQPNLLASVVVLHQMGAGMEDIDVPLHVLLVAYQAMKASGHKWPVISEDTQDFCLNRLTGSVRLSEGLPTASLQQSIQQHIDEHREPYLLAFASGHLQDNDMLPIRTEAQKFLVLATLNIVECIAFAGARLPAVSRRTTKQRQVER